MPNRKKILINMILDKSGSMSSIAAKTISGYNEYLETLIADADKDDKMEYLVSLTMFDDKVDIKYKYVDVHYAPKLTSLTYNPGGMTALCDALCTTINDTVEQDLYKDVEKIITVIFTDGQENASSTYDTVEARKMVLEKKNDTKSNWTFVYFGCDQDAWAESSRIGIGAGNTISYAKGAMNNVVGANAFAAISHSRSANLKSTSYSTLVDLDDDSKGPDQGTSSPKQ